MVVGDWRNSIYVLRQERKEQLFFFFGHIYSFTDCEFLECVSYMGMFCYGTDCLKDTRDA